MKWSTVEVALVLGGKWKSFEMHAREAKITVKRLLKVFLVRENSERKEEFYKESIYLHKAFK